MKLISGIANQQQLIETSLVIKHSWQHAYEGVLPSKQLAKLDEHIWQKTLLRPGRHNIIVLDNGRVEGVVSYGQPRDGEPSMEGLGELMAIYVAPDSQEQGIGTVLLQKAEEGLAELGFTRFALWVLADNQPSRKFYEAHGWQNSGQSQERLILGNSVKLIQYQK